MCVRWSITDSTHSVIHNAGKVNEALEIDRMTRETSFSASTESQLDHPYWRITELTHPPGQQIELGIGN